MATVAVVVSRSSASQSPSFSSSFCRPALLASLLPLLLILSLVVGSAESWSYLLVQTQPCIRTQPCTPPSEQRRLGRRRMLSSSIRRGASSLALNYPIAVNRIGILRSIFATTRMMSSTSAAGGGGRDGAEEERPSSPSLTSQRLASLLVCGPSSVDASALGANDPLDKLVSSISSSLSSSTGSSSSLPPMSAVLALSGGCVRSSSALATTPGSSSILRECVFPYDRTSFAEFVSKSPPPPGEVLQFATEGTMSGTDGGKGFSFASAASAALLSDAALRRSMELSGALGDVAGCVGIGCTSMLVSSDSTKESKVHIAVSSADGTTEFIDAVLSAYDGGGLRKERRDRVEEDEVASSLLLLAAIRKRYDLDGIDDESLETAVKAAANAVLDRGGDSWSGRSVCALPSSAAPGIGPQNDEEPNNTALLAARRVLSGESSSGAALLLPSPSFTGRGGTFVPKPLLHTVLPPDPLIFPGSFNPPHVGHVALANAAVKAMDRKRKEEWEGREKTRRSREGSIAATNRGRSFLSTKDSASSSMGGASSFSEGEGLAQEEEEGQSSPTAPSDLLDDVWSAVEYHNYKSPPSILFEMSLTNPDKPPMDEGEAARRVGLFGQCLENVGGGEESKVEMPKDWAVLLTSCPLFVQKVEALGRTLAPTRGAASTTYNGQRRRKMTFVIGTDTMVRIINPKYYGDGSYESMLEAVREMGDAGAHFVVGGRLEQGKGEGEESRFVTGEEELSSLPDDVRDMFTIIREEDFRLDLSSTQLRKRKMQQKA